MRYGRHLSNIYDHRKPNAERYHITDFHTQMSGPEAVHEDWPRYLDWIGKNVIGPPKATDYYTQQELEEKGMIGVYAPAEEEANVGAA